VRVGVRCEARRAHQSIAGSGDGVGGVLILESLFQKTMEIRFARKALPRPGDSGIPYQRSGKVASSLVAFAEGLAVQCGGECADTTGYLRLESTVSVS